MTVWLQRFVVHYTRRLFTILPELGNVGFGHRRKSWSKTTLQRDLLNHWILAICPFFDMQKSVRSTQQFVCWLFNFLMEFLRFERFWTHFLKRLFGRQSWFIFLGFFLACISDLTQLKAKIEINLKFYLKKNKKMYQEQLSQKISIVSPLIREILIDSLIQVYR